MVFEISSKNHFLPLWIHFIQFTSEFSTTQWTIKNMILYHILGNEYADFAQRDMGDVTIVNIDSWSENPYHVSDRLQNAYQSGNCIFACNNLCINILLW